MGAFFSGLWAVIKAAPAIWSLWKEISSIAEWAMKEIDSKQRIEKLKDGMEFARKTKDTSKIEAIFK